MPFLVQGMLGMSPEQRLNFVAVNKTFQARRKVLLDQRQAIYGLLQRPLTRYNNAEDTISEFLKVLRLIVIVSCHSTGFGRASRVQGDSAWCPIRTLVRDM